MSTTPRRQRLLILSHHGRLGGAEIALLESIEQLSEAFDVVVAVGTHGELSERLARAGVEVIDATDQGLATPHQSLRRVTGVVRLLRAVWSQSRRVSSSAGPVDLVYANTLKSALGAQLLALRLRRPWIWHLRDRLELGYLSSVGTIALRTLANRGPRLIIANSRGTMSTLPPRARRKAVVITSPVRVTELRALAAQRRARTAPDATFTIAVIARLTPIKGQDLVIEALAAVDPSVPVRLRLYGADQTPGGTEAARLRDLAEHFGVADRVEFAGHVDPIDDKLGDLDAVVSFPRHPEPFGQAVIQAMAAGVPVIAAAEGGPAESITDRTTGLLVRPRSPQDLAAAIEELARDPGLCERLGRQASASVDRFAGEVVLPRLIDSIRAVAEGRHPVEPDRRRPTPLHPTPASDPPPVRMAIVHEWLNGPAGSEKTFVELARTFPAADLYALTRHPDVAFDVGDRSVATTALQYVAARRGGTALTLPLMPVAWSIQQVPDYDVVISSSHAYSRAFRPARHALHLSYTHTPMRYVWLQDLDRRSRVGTMPAWTLAPFRKLDLRYAATVDSFAANSTTTRDRIREFYGRDARVIPPPCDTEYFTIDDGVPRSGLLSVSRFVPYKRHDLAIQVAAALGEHLVIAGHGPDEARLRALADEIHPGGVEFVVAPADDELRHLYRSASALVFGAIEDFGIVPVEAQGCGTPVIAPSQGGTSDSVLDGTSGRLVTEVSVDAFACATADVLRSPPPPDDCRQSAARFSTRRFHDDIRSWVADHL